MSTGFKGKYEIVTADDNLPGKVMLYEKAGRDCYTNRHWHKNLEIDFIIRGRMWTNIGGEDRDLSDGDFVVINSETVHQTCGKIPEEPVKYLVVLFSYSYIKTYFEDYDRYTIDLSVSEQTRSRVRELLKAIVFDMENPSDLSKLRIFCAMSQILMYLLSKCRVRKPPSEQPEPDEPAYITRAVDFIKTHYMERLTLEDISSFVGLTPTYFSRYFRNTTRQTFKGYLNLVRLENTLIDIQQNGMSETRASLENGFPSVKSFISVFKSVYGCPPSEYVKLYHEEPPISQINSKIVMNE